MISKHSICFSKKIIYLILLVIICGLILIINSSGKINTYKTKASTTTPTCNVLGYYPVTTDQGFSSMYYDENCKINEDRPVWNGLYGSKAKCYTATAVCSKSPICILNGCVAKISDTIKCLYQEVNISTCISAGKAPIEAGQSFSCPPPGKPIYAWWDSKTCYLMNGQLIPSKNGSKPYCVATKVDNINLCSCYVNGNCLLLTQTPTPTLTLTPKPTQPIPTQTIPASEMKSICSGVTGKIARRYLNYEGKGLDGCILFTGYYYNLTKINPILDPHLAGINRVALSLLDDSETNYCSTGSIIDCRTVSPTPSADLTVENLSYNICPSIKGKVAHIYKDYGGVGKDACVKFNGLYYSITKPNPIVTEDVISGTDIENYCSTYSSSSLTYSCH